MITTISKGQQITIPASMRDLLGLDVGTRVDIEVEDGKVVIAPIGENMEEVFKKSKYMKPKRNLTAEQMDELNEELFR